MVLWIHEALLFGGEQLALMRPLLKSRCVFDGLLKLPVASMRTDEVMTNCYCR